MITLGALVLPSGLIWSDEHAWTPIAQSAGDYSLTGALLMQESVKLSGRPITLSFQQDGNEHTAWIRRSQTYNGWSSLDALRSALLVPNVRLTLTLHDNRQFVVSPRHDGDGAIRVKPQAVYKSFSLANPGPEYFYYLEAVRLIEVPL